MNLKIKNFEDQTGHDSGNVIFKKTKSTLISATFKKSANIMLLFPNMPKMMPA